MDQSNDSIPQGDLPNSTIDRRQQHEDVDAITLGTNTNVVSQDAQLSRRSTSLSTASQAEARTATAERMLSIKNDVIANWIYTTAMEKQWTKGSSNEGVYVKKEKGRYAQCPDGDAANPSSLRKAVETMNVRSAMTVSTPIIDMILSSTETDYVQISHGQRIQIIPDFDALPFCQRYQSAAFVRSHQLLVVWDDDANLLIDHAKRLQESLMEGFFKAKIADENKNNKEAKKDANVEVNTFIEDGNNGKDKSRRVPLWQTIYTTLAIMLLITCIASGYRKVAIEIVVDPNWLRLLFLLVLPASVWLGLFFFQAVVGIIAQCVSRSLVTKSNSKYYSAVPPRPLDRDFLQSLPHVTIQMPCYNESLEKVIKPTVQSVKQAISTYELQGGTASIFINDDGMQIASQEEQIERQEFYEENAIGWVARPKHNPKGENDERVFHRRGRFKKASNMNYGMRLSCDIEDKLAMVHRHEKWTQQDENEAYRTALAEILDERQGEAWAGGSIRMGDYILLIDCDTRVPDDCLLEAVSEMEQSPQVAILQHVSGVMNVTDTFFERGITFFTNMIYTMIAFSVASGDVAPFVGHNAFLRWSALQHVAYDCEEDNWEKYWSESTVSEDFDMSLRLQAEGFTVRLATYKGDGFKEGVSLTVYDELARWEKYAYGCNELIFHPLKYWPTRGPVTPLFRRFISSDIPFPSKITIMAYIGTYYAIGSAWIFTTMNYFLVGFFNGFLDHYYLDSFRAYVAIVVVFSLAGNVSLAIMRSRANPANIFANLWQNFKWVPLLSIFLGGLSLHISQALLCHFFSINMQWGATAKQAVDVKFWIAMGHVGRRFCWTFTYCAAMTAAMVVCAYVVQEDWQIRLLTAIWPMASIVIAHALLPIVLNPELMRFSW